MPLLAQIQLDINQLVAIAGVSGTTAIIVAVAVFLVANRLSKSQLVNAKADAETQQAVNKMAFKNAEQVIDLHAQNTKQNNRIISLMEKQSKDREEYHQLKVDYVSLQKDFKQLQSTVKQHEQKIAKLTLDLNAEQQKSSTLEKQLEGKEQELQQYREENAYLKAERKALVEENERYKSYQQKQDTQPIPNVVIEVDGDNLITPIIKPTNGNPADDSNTETDTNNQPKEDIA